MVSMSIAIHLIEVLLGGNKLKRVNGEPKIIFMLNGPDTLPPKHSGSAEALE